MAARRLHVPCTELTRMNTLMARRADLLTAVGQCRLHYGDFGELFGKQTVNSFCNAENGEPRGETGGFNLQCKLPYLPGTNTSGRSVLLANVSFEL